MFMRASAMGLLAVMVFGSTSQAQLQQPQVVQLPTFSFFHVSTTVSVPDRGRALMGGVRRRRVASNSRGLPWISGLPAAARLARSRALSSEASSSGASATATIMDLKELDEAMLAEAAARRGVARRIVSEADRKAMRLTRHVGSNSSAAAGLRLGSSTQSVAEIRQRNAVEDAGRGEELMTLWKQARAAEAAGRLGAARCNYQVLSRRGKGKLREAALARLAALSQQSDVAQPQ